MKRSVIAWNHLTVSDVQNIITHFSEAETTYRRRVTLAPPHLAALWDTNATRVHRLRVFWETTLPLVEAGERIDGRVRQFISQGK